MRLSNHLIFKQLKIGKALVFSYIAFGTHILSILAVADTSGVFNLMDPNAQLVGTCGEIVGDCTKLSQDTSLLLKF